MQRISVCAHRHAKFIPESFFPIPNSMLASSAILNSLSLHDRKDEESRPLLLCCTHLIHGLRCTVHFFFAWHVDNKEAEDVLSLISIYTNRELRGACSRDEGFS